MAERTTMAVTGTPAAAGRVSELFGRIHETLSGWREAILTGEQDGALSLDDRVAALVLPALAEDDPLLIGAGFVAAPEPTGAGDVRFSWWLGPLDDNPVFGATRAPSKFDLGARSYSDYLRDFASLEWFSVPQSTHRTHITGPYVDHLCACDYIVTVTSPVERDGRMLGVVGLDLSVKRLERELLPGMLACSRPLALVNEHGRVTVSTDPAVLVGTVLPAAPDAVTCPGTTFRLVETGA